MDATLTVEFLPAVEFSGQTYDKLELREPTGGEVEKAYATGAQLKSTILLISLVSGVPRGAVEKVGISKIREASKFLEGFISEPGPETGGN